jgi:hypothetical protein
MNRHGIFQLALMLTVLPRAVWCQPVAQPKHLLIVNASAIKDSDLAAVYVAAAQVGNAADWRVFTVPENSGLSRWLASEYNLTGSNIERYPATAAAMSAMIVKVNDLKSDQLSHGQQLRLPVLPAIPDVQAAHDLVQIPVSGQTYRAVPLSSLAEINYASHPDAAIRQLAANIAFQDSAALRTSLLRQGSLRTARKLYTGPSELLPLELLGESHCNSGAILAEPSAPALAVDPELRRRVAAIPTEAAGYLYVLDFNFGSRDCTHGNKVLDVLRSRLREYGAHHLTDNIKTLELNFFGRPDQARDTLEMILGSVIDLSFACHYRRLFAESHGVALPSCETPLRDLPVVAQNLGEQNVSVPGYYLWLLYEFLLDSSSKASVVSSSFFTLANGFDIAGASLVNKWPALVTAVLNPDKFPPSRADELGAEQPTKSFFIRRLEFGTFLVGAVLRDGTSFGMTSSDAPEFSNAVTALQFGDGYGEFDAATGVRTSCIAPTDKGTSFATPALAVDLFLARALWRSQSPSPGAIVPDRTDLPFASMTDPVPVLEAKRRLALAATVVPELVGKAATAGIPDLALLAAPAPRGVDVAVAIDGTIKQISVSTARVRYDGFLQSYPAAFGAIQVHNGITFVFDESRRAWRAVETNEDFYVQITQLSQDVGGGQSVIETVEFRSPDAFASTYLSIARYK